MSTIADLITDGQEMLAEQERQEKLAEQERTARMLSLTESIVWRIALDEGLDPREIEPLISIIGEGWSRGGIKMGDVDFVRVTIKITSGAVVTRRAVIEDGKFSYWSHSDWYVRAAHSQPGPFPLPVALALAVGNSPTDTIKYYNPTADHPDPRMRYGLDAVG